MHLQPGSSLGRYKVLSPLGAGGMGEVYLAHDTRLNRQVALKVLPASLIDNRERLLRFEQEAKAASALNHPNIITIHDIGSEGDTHFIATEYIEGVTLRRKLQTRLEIKETLNIATQTLAALDAAHRSGIVHRDIKPENIMVREDGLVKVLDFGLAKLAETRAADLDSEAATRAQVITEAGMILGTVAYMSPEQARGLVVDARTDIFSLGVVLYEMLTGRSPFAGATTSDVIAAILKFEPEPATNFNQEIPSELDGIISRTLLKDRENRYQTAKDLQIDLRRLNTQFDDRRETEHGVLPNKAESESEYLTKTLAAPATSGAGYAPVRLRKHKSDLDVDLVAKRNHRSIVLGSLALLGVSALIVAGVWLARARRESLANVAVQNVTQITNWSGLDDFPSLSPDGNYVAYSSDHNDSFEIYVKQLTTGAKDIQLTSGGGQNFQPAWSPDGQRIAYHSKLRGGIWVIPASSSEARQVTDFGTHPAWSPDGKQIVFQSNPLVDLAIFSRNALPPSTLWIVSAQGGEPRQLTQIGKPAGGHGAPSFSPDGKRIVFEVDSYNVASVWTISKDGGDEKQVTKAPNSAYEPVYATDGRSIFYSAGGVFQVHLNPDTSEPIGEPMQIAGIGGTFSGVRRLSFSADGKKMAYSTLLRRESLTSARLRADSAEGDGAPVPLVQNTNERNNFPTFSPDGKRIAFSTCNMGGTACDIWVMNADGSNQIQLTTNESSELMPSWFPDMEHIAYTSNRTGHSTLWKINLATKREWMLLDLKDSLDYVRLSPDGNHIVFNFKRNDGVINVWRAALAGGEPKQLTFDKELMGFPAWSPDGNYLAFNVKRGDDTHVMLMPSEGGTPVQLTNDKGQSWTYGWSPDGDKPVFAGFRNGLWNIRWVSRSTKKQYQVTNHTKLNSFVRYPAWSPKGDQIVYEYSETTGNIWIAGLK